MRPAARLRQARRIVRTVAGLLASAVVAVAGAGAYAGGIDFGAIAARSGTAAADALTPKAQRARYRAISRRVARPDRPGLADDFAKLEFVAAAVRRPLAADVVLGQSLGDAVTAGLDALGVEGAHVVVSALDVEPGHGRSRADARVRRAHRLAASAEVQQSNGRADRACALGASSARAFAGAASLVAKLVRRQDRRPPGWQVVLDSRDGALLSVHCDATGPVYVVGAHDAEGPQFLRGGAEGWVRVPVAAGGDLWWVDSVPGAGVWTSGSGGNVHEYDPVTGAVASRPIGHDVVVYGVWGSGASDVWAVGEDPDTSGPLPAAFHWNGVSWSGAALPAAAAGVALYKVWGAAAGDVWACGRQGTLLHFDGTQWTSVESGTTSSILTVHGTSPAVAVGLAPAIVERSALGDWAPVPLPGATDALNGVRVGEGGEAWAVGYFRTILRRSTRGWARVAGAPTTQGRDYHAVTIDAAGGVWIAGGELTSLTGGVLLYRGTRTVGNDVLPRAGLAGRVRDVFTRTDSCAQAACHAPPFLSEELDLETAAGLRGRITGVPSRQSPLPLVAPGRPSASYLFRKIAGTHAAVGGTGVRMPQGEDPLTPEETDAVRAWILEGALDD